MSTVSTEKGSPWHAGELALQEKVGVAAKMQELGRRVIRDYMPDQHRTFYRQLPFIVAGAVADDGDVWATLVAGQPGFMQSPTEKVLHMAVAADPHDPASGGLHEGAAIGLLGIELHTRRRNRMNGLLRGATPHGFDVEVIQSFGNCPQYIQARDFEFIRDPGSFSAIAPKEFAGLTGHARAMIEAADTLFVASYVGEGEHRQVDVSHRGGKAGFVRIGDDGRLTIPDFAGNLFFATLGNFLVNPRAGLVFADFETGDLLQLTGEATVDLDSPEIAAFQGAERLWHFTPRRIVYREGALPLRWKFQANGWSPNSLMTGSWDEVTSRLKAAELANAWRPFKVTNVVDESSVIRSFHLEPVDGAGLIPHIAGQHLPIRVMPPGHDKAVIRTYTLSTAPADGLYRISVKRDGLVSSHLHDTLHIGSIVEARAPAGQFTIDAAERRPAVLLAAGVGITPMLAMLRHIVYEGLRTRRVRPTWFFQSARTLKERAFSREIETLAASAKGAVNVVRALSHIDGAREGKDFDVEGRIDVALLCDTLPFNDYDFYLCGPSAFMQSMYDGLRNLNVADNRIHAEAFGPSGLQRRKDAAAVTGPVRVAAEQPVPIAFVKSGKEARWSPDSGSLLELAEARGLNPEFGCRGGSCGTCRTRIVEGAVAYTMTPEFTVPDDEALICCAVPANADTGGGDRLLLDL
ncbi:pyridoxamine 5'-phosphate oxidase family protein [Paraburkholderia caribensis]|uniref:FAD-binding oxidoreductase n=1 Tax=Paraburkholderia caribensis TaxID=75105 RepID=A0A9Q6SA09_9BURK|nr:pyridoxamine 5'-phosphate oxidase family protein [Paraburkholderia caribensis]ALP67779.1 FAD-binding oxidoreductase [Paraburkholderia caribensis]AUT57514.1 FAD-binding oxidoreductase [Paraburkholderia caribensis]MCO4876236.1 pyridoxamine 5'-phosphate oxidase family protein [Paraburkholderia caribensis]PTB29750.1 FAD-binding oxidoreductase [Paraburkholderia caribensis]QLB67434.1 FAD-binding oxidoreductase [Paraburkholderia caribensis]